MMYIEWEIPNIDSTEMPEKMQKRKIRKKHFNRILMAKSCWNRENTENFSATHQLGKNK